MTEMNELPIEAVVEWVLTYLKYHVSKNEEISDPVAIVEGMLFYARDYLLDQAIKERDVELINQAKTINSLVNILRGQPSVDYWNGCLNDRELPINQPVFS